MNDDNGGGDVFDAPTTQSGPDGTPPPAAPRRRLGMPGRPRPGEYLETVLRDPDPIVDPEAPALPGYPLTDQPHLTPAPRAETDPSPAPAAAPVPEPRSLPQADPSPDPAPTPDPRAEAAPSLAPAAVPPAAAPQADPRPGPAPAHGIAEQRQPSRPAPEPVARRALARSAPEPGVALAPERSAPELDAVGQVPLKAALEAILMIVDEPATVAHLAEVLVRPKRAVSAALRELAEEYTAQGRGFDLRFVAGGWRFYSRASCAPAVDRYVLDGQHARLTQAALETLAVIAYRQPVSRSRVSAVRGVNCDGVMRTLVQRGLVEETGSEPETGAILYRTTQQFLERMGLRGLDELPELAPFLPEADEVEPDSQEGSAIAEAVAAQS